MAVVSSFIILLVKVAGINCKHFLSTSNQLYSTPRPSCPSNHSWSVMSTQLPGDGQPCRLLEYPREIRDQIYAEVLLDFPTPSLERLSDRAAHEVVAIKWDFDVEGHDGAEHEIEQEGNKAPAFHESAVAFLQKTHKIDTNILLANRQTFAEAKEIILRRAHLVKVVTSNVDLSRRLFASQLCLVDVKYSNLCIMTHYCM